MNDNNKIDLNTVDIETDGSPSGQTDHSIVSGSVSVYFKSLKNHLIDAIGSADVVLGCVAWLTDSEVLEALSKKAVSIVVQKEDFLRPDYNGGQSGFKKYLRKKYSALSPKVCRYGLPGIGTNLSTSSDPILEPIRCVGNHNSEKKPAWPRMHNKFLVFCTDPAICTDPAKGKEFWEPLVPHSVWTGSFNLTDNATRSFENALLIKDEKIAMAYGKEFSQILSLSEQLDWCSEWVAPEFRIGT